MCCFDGQFLMWFKPIAQSRLTAKTEHMGQPMTNAMQEDTGATHPRNATRLLSAQRRSLMLAIAPSIFLACADGGPAEEPLTGIPLSGTLAGKCVAPGMNEGPGNLDTERKYVRSIMNEGYLWYKEIPEVDANKFQLAAYKNDLYTTLSAYFEALKTTSKTPSGKLTDEFSFTVKTADRMQQQSGISSGYGIRFAFINRMPPRLLRVLYVEPGSPAETAGVLRGDTVKSIDGVSIDDNTEAGTATLSAGLSPRVASKTTVFGLQAPGALEPRNVSVTSSQNIAVPAVVNTDVISDNGRTVGYMVFNSFAIAAAEQQLFDAFTKFKNAAVNELVLDLRYNGGGFVILSNQLAWMIGGPSLEGKVYEKTLCNDKNSFSICNKSDVFQKTTVGLSGPKDRPLPQLGLSRVFVLTSASTCSASEALINGLAPFVNVIRLGSTTCGKPYGFTYKDNCGTSYALMQFKGVNADGFGDYADGFAPTCKVADDLSKARGDVSELMLAGALTYMRTGQCPAPSSGIQKPRDNTMPIDPGNYQMLRSPMEEIRILNLPEGVQ
jgi:carboxyl-terminal processing protease